MKPGRLLRLPELAAAAALSLALDRCTGLAGGDAVTVAFEDFLGNPSDDGFRALCAFELLCELFLKVCDI